MEVILGKDIQKLGKTGDLVKVKDGFARNFLFPNKFAMSATKENLKNVNALKKARTALVEKEKGLAEELAKKLESVSFSLSAEANGEDKLYGSIDELTVARLLEVQGYKIDKKNIIIDAPVKSLGTFYVRAKLYPEVEAKIKILVVKK